MQTVVDLSASVKSKTDCSALESIPHHIRFASRWMVGLLVVSDLVMLMLGGGIGFMLRRFFGAPELEFGLYFELTYVLIAFIFVYQFRGLYPAIGIGVVEEFRRLTISTTLVFLLLVAFTFLLHESNRYSRVVFSLAYLADLALVPAGRIALRHLAVRVNAWGEPVAVVGPPDKAIETVNRLACDPKIGLRPVVIFTENTMSLHGLPPEIRVLPERMISSCRSRLNLKTILVLVSDLDDLVAVRRKYEDYFARITLVRTGEQGKYLQGISSCRFGGLTGLVIHQNLLSHTAQIQKRIIDVLVSSLGLILLSPLLALVALAIRLDSPGPVFYRQRRVGRKGESIEMLKFRTMHVNADEVLREELLKNLELKTEWDQYQKLKNDPRITRVGRLIRRVSIDELPQLWNVFTGTMSLVGPRPIMLNQRELYGNAIADYVRVTPGITGLWQISGRNLTTFQTRTEYDMQYVLNWSVWLDIYILVRTIWVVLRCEGAG